LGENLYRLLVSRRLGPLFWAQFAGALNDNLLKNAYVILVAYREAQSTGATEMIVTLATAIFILPFFLFSAIAGELADKYAKSLLVRRIKTVEIMIALLGALSFAVGDIALQLFVLFLLGAQATFFGPVKYAILPELLAEKELLDGNALIEAGTFLAILLGTIAGGLLILLPWGKTVTSAALIVIAVAGYGASSLVPKTKRTSPKLPVSLNVPMIIWAVIADARKSREIWLTVLGNSWFWFVGAGVISQFPIYAKEYLSANNEVVTAFLMVNSIGVGLGALFCSRFFRGEISARLVPISVSGMALFTFDLWFGAAVPHGGESLMSIATFLAEPAHWRTLVDLFGVAFSAGVYVVPLYVIMQAHSEPAERSRVIAANNILNALFIVVAGGGSAIMLKLGTGVPAIFLVLAVLNAVLAAALWLRRRALRIPPRR